MARHEFDLKTLLDIPLWENIQDQLAVMTGTAIITVDFKGIPITKHSGRTDFCSVIRENPVSRKRCFRCDALAGLEAVRLGKPYIYLCHCGIVDVAVPVIVGNKYLGAVMFGQVRLPNDDTEAKVERLVNEISSFQEEEASARQDLLKMYEQLPELEYKRIVKIAELIDTIVKYIISHAVKNENTLRTYNWLLKSNKENQDIEDISEISEDSFPEPAVPQYTVNPSSSIYPAVVYIHEHLKETITMKSMSDLCHLSPSYFSRLFNRETGETFINYVNRQKIQLAKSMLRNTKDSITRIAGELGYINVSHFIGLFKQLEGVTPSVYRRYKYK